MRTWIFGFFIFFVSTYAYGAKGSFFPKSFQADFQQMIKSSISGKNKVSTGKIFYLYPKKMRFEVVTPDQSIFSSDGIKTWYYTAPFIEGEKGELQISTKADNSVLDFFDLLRKGLKKSAYFKVSGEKGAKTLNFNEEGQKKIGVKQAVLQFQGPELFTNLRTLGITYSDGRQVQLRFKNIIENPALKSELFIFKAPKDTNITYL